MNKKELLSKIEKLIDEFIKKETNIYFEDHNFKIDSKSWKIVKGKVCKESPAGDIWEITAGEFKGEQLFTWEAAMRETQEAGKTIPTEKEWVKISEKINIQDTMKMVGCRNFAGTLNDQGSLGYYWSSSISGTNSLSLNFNSSSVRPANTYNRALGLAVRCLKN